MLGLEPLEGRDAHGPAHVVVGGPVARAVLRELAAHHEAVAVDHELLARGAHEVVLAAHEDRLLGAGVHAEAAVDAAQEVDLEAGGVLLDVLLRALPGLDVDALGGAHGRAHVAGHALGGAVLARGEEVDAAVAARGVALLLGELDGRGLAQEQGADEVLQGEGHPRQDGGDAQVGGAVDGDDAGGHGFACSAPAGRSGPSLRRASPVGSPAASRACPRAPIVL